MNVTFKRIANGEFQVYQDGNPAGYRIFNGAAGMHGDGRQRGSNIYGVVNLNGKIIWLQSLQNCKKSVTRWLGGAK